MFLEGSVKCLLIGTIPEISTEEIKYTSEYDSKKVVKTNVRDLLKIIALLFFEDGVPVPAEKIAKKLGLQKAGKFTERVILYHLIKKKRGKWIRLVNYLYDEKRRRYYFHPLALILKTESGEILDFTELDEFYENLYKFSQKVEVNILKESINLGEFLLIFKGMEREAVKKLSELCKMTTSSFGKYELATLEEYVSRGFFLEDISQKTRDSRYRFGNLVFNFILWYGNGREEFFYDGVICEYVEVKKELPGEIREVAEEILRKKKRDADERGQVFDNHPGYKLLKIKIEREIEEKSRKKKIYLTFGPTDFYTFVCTNQSIDEPVLKSKGGFTTMRRKYIKEVDLSEPDYLTQSFLSNMFGVALTTITEDNKIILQKRSRQVFMGPMRCTLATAENMVRGLDEDGKPNPFFTAKRCIREELGEEIKLEDIMFLGFGIRLDNLLPQALGMVKLRMKSSELNFTKAKDRWEGKNFLEEFTPHNLKKKKYFEESYSISDTAKLTILLALIHEFDFEDVKRGLNLDTLSCP